MPDGFMIGSFKIYFYGIIVTFGILVSAWLASFEARRRGLNGDLVWDILVWLMIGGVIGARLWHIFSPPQSMVEQGVTTTFYLTHPLDLINIRNGGLGIPGAVIGGLLALYIYCRKQKLDFVLWTDVLAPCVPLGQAIGRWGNFFNQELYGAPTDLPWGIFISPERRLQGYQSFSHFHPLFLYESLWNLASMAFLLWLGRRFPDRLKKGDLFLLYCVLYPTARFALEYLRLDASHIAGLNSNQVIMAAIAILSAAALIIRHKQPQVNTPTEPD